MKLHASGEDYLKAIFILQNEKGLVRSVDVSEYMGVSKPSVSHAVKLLRKGGFLTKDNDHFLHLTDLGRETAEKIYERYQYFSKHLVGAGVDSAVAEEKPAVWSTQSVTNHSKNLKKRNRASAHLRKLVL